MVPLAHGLSVVIESFAFLHDKHKRESYATQPGYSRGHQDQALPAMTIGTAFEATAR
ncbi:hypothetical protein [Azorhizophilus paspali]|uniref:hypothetical protein n=1 Tax=Azorhizophilus paspali TaxID=69963 RepID=UPI003644AA65